MGRKPTEKSGDKRQLGVRLSKAGWERLDDLSDYYGLSLQDTIELLLEKQVASLDPLSTGDAYDLCHRLYEYLTRKPRDRRKRRTAPMIPVSPGSFLARVSESVERDLARRHNEQYVEPQHTPQ